DDLDLVWQRNPERVWALDRGPAWPAWVPGGAFNLTESALDRWVDEGLGERVAVIAERDDGTVTRMTFGELHAETIRVAAGLREAGIRAGDRVGVLMPMVPEAVVA